MTQNKLMLFTIALLLISQRTHADEQWYTPVDIGQYLDTNAAPTAIELTETAFQTIMQADGSLQEDALRKYRSLRDDWLATHGEEYIKKFDYNKAFLLDSSLSGNLYQFSNLEAKFYITFTYGHSRWHHYYIALANFLVERTPYIDTVFNLPALEQRYSYSFEGLTHGTTIETMEKILGTDYQEYAGQSPQYRKIYYEQYDIEIIIQAQVVKFVQQGKPGWMDSDMKIIK